MIFTENNAVKVVLQPVADAYAADPATATVKLSLFSHATFLLVEAAGGTGTVTVTLEECTAANGAGATAIPFRYRVSADAGVTFGALQAAAATGFTTTAGANKVVAVEVDDRDLSEDSPWVRLQLVEVADAPCLAGVVALLSKPRNARAILATPS